MVDFVTVLDGKLGCSNMAPLTFLCVFAAAWACQLLRVAGASQYKVGDSNGWNAGLSLQENEAWSDRITFFVNDTLYFKYIPGAHNVLQVDLAHYQLCNTSDPISIYQSGDDLFILATPQTYYFICGLKQYCIGGLKLAVKVQVPAPAPTPAPAQQQQQQQVQEKSKSSSNLVLIASASLGGIVMVAAAVGTILHCMRCCSGSSKALGAYDGGSQIQSSTNNASDGLVKVASATPTHQKYVLDTLYVRPYTVEQVKEISNNFQNQIGKGGFGPVYSGKLADGQEVAIKVCSGDSQGEGEFINEVKLLSRAHHKNIVPLVGYCQEDGHQILLYELLHGGDLNARLQGRIANSSPLDWRTRLSIALDAAKGLEYLHCGCELTIIHRDVKSSNILLTNKLSAKVADFGLSKLAPSEDISHVSTELKGTAGYLDPEYYITRQLTDRSDVYSFGVLLVEIICGRNPIFREASGVHVHLVEWVKQQLQTGNIEAIVDPLLQGDYEIEAVWKVTEIALQCTDIHRGSRPSMSAVVRELKQAINIELGMSTSDRSNAIPALIKGNGLLDNKREMNKFSHSFVEVTSQPTAK